jgi:hypothetical protein
VYKLAFFCLFCFFLTSCEEFNIFDTDSISSEYIELNNFSEICSYSPMNLFLEQDSVCSMKIVANKKIINKFKYQILKGRLSLESGYENWSQNLKPIEIFIKYKQINNIIIETPCAYRTINPITTSKFNINIGSGSELLDLDLDLQTEELNIKSSGKIMGGIRLKGKSIKCNYVLNGNVKLNFKIF